VNAPGNAGKYSINLRLALAETYFAAGDARQALLIFAGYRRTKP
jgi:hypothetical protein